MDDDSRRFQIYFQIDEDRRVQVYNLPLTTYLKFKHNDEYLFNYCSIYHKSTGGIEKLYRSLDDIEYSLVNISHFITKKSLDIFNNNNIAREEERIHENISNEIHHEFEMDYTSSDFSFNMDNVVNKNGAFVKINEGSDHTYSAGLVTNTNSSSLVTISNERPNDLVIGETNKLTVIPSTSSLNTELNAFPTKIKASPIWKHVTRGSKGLICTYCKKEFVDNKNTSNMLKHLRNKHPLFFNSENNLCNNGGMIKTAKKRILLENNDVTQSTSGKLVNKDSNTQNTIPKVFKRIDSFKGGEYYDKITNAILFMICKDMLPISIVEKEGFVCLLNIVSPLYKIPSRKTIINKLEARYDVMKSNFMKKIKNIDSYCLTCDNWTDCSNQSYLAVTIHFLNETLNMESGCLGCIPLEERHTADYLKNSLIKIFEDFSIPIMKISTMISDGEAAIRKACRDIVGTNKHLRCFAHIMAHILPVSLKNDDILNAILNKLKTTVTTIKRSIPASNKLKKLQLDAGKSEGQILHLIQDVPTRWTTVIDMIERYLELDHFIYLAISELAKPIDILSRKEIQILKDLLPIIQPIKNVIVEISGETYSTASIIIPIIYCMENQIEMVKPDTELIQNYKTHIQDIIKTQFKDIESCFPLSIATILDPRFKTIYFKNEAPLSDSLNEINNMLKLLQNNDNCLDITKAAEIKISKELNSIWEYHDSLEANNTIPTQHFDALTRMVELDQYLILSRISRKENPFLYWKNVLASSFPNLSKLAFYYLPVVSTSVASERIFSRANLIKRDNRNRITGTHLDILIFLSSLAKEDWNILEI